MMASIQTKFGSFTFRFIPTLFAIAGISLFVTLGCWQLHRAQEKILLQIEYESRTKHPVINIDEIKANSVRDKWLFYPLKLSGHFDNHYTLLLDNRFYQHQLGYHVLTPFIIDDQEDISFNRKIPHQLSQDKTVVLIDRGFIPLGINRQTLPLIPPVEGTLQITGIITQPDAKSFALSHIVDNPGHWPVRIELIDFPMISQLIQQPLLPIVLVLSANQPGTEGMKYDWQLTTQKPEMHRGYAVQWFAMAVVLGVLFVIMGFKRKS